MIKFLHWLKHEVISAIPAILYFAFAFNIIHIAEALILKPLDIQYTSFLGANVGAIIAGKIILIANALPFINAFPNKPLIYNISWKFLIYSLCAILFQLFDIFCKHAYHDMSLSMGYQHLEMSLSSPQFWSIQILIVGLFLNYVIFSEFIHAIGKNKIKHLLLG